MLPTSTATQRPVALAAFRGQHFLGYAVKSPDGWTCVASIGMTWSKIRCRTMEEARSTLRTTSHASRFDTFLKLDDLTRLVATLPPYQQPAIGPQEVADVKPKLALRSAL
jgi:hypothetical protein